MPCLPKRPPIDAGLPGSFGLRTGCSVPKNFRISSEEHQYEIHQAGPRCRGVDDRLWHKSRPAEGHQNRRSARKPVRNQPERGSSNEPVWPVLANRFLVAGARCNHQDRGRAVPELDGWMRMRSGADEAPGLRATTAATAAARTTGTTTAATGAACSDQREGDV